MRINKYLSGCGLGSRRKVEEYIIEGRVKINGEVVDDLSYVVDTEKDVVVFNRSRIELKRYYYLMLNKPRGYVTSMQDEHGRAVVMDLVHEKYRKNGVVPVGRLDMDSEGLLLLTNDGDMAYKLTHPKFNVEKQYVVTIDEPLDDKARCAIEKGIYLYGERTKPAEIFPLDREGMQWRMHIREGKKRHIRMAFQKFGFKVRRLKRITFGPLHLSGVNSGDFRILKDSEIRALKKSVQN